MLGSSGGSVVIGSSEVVVTTTGVPFVLVVHFPYLQRALLFFL